MADGDNSGTAVPDVPDVPEGATVEQVNGGAGVIVRAANGRFLPGTRTPKPITHDNVHSFVARRVEGARQRAAAGMVQAVIKRGKLPREGARPAAAWGAVIEHATGVMLDADSPRAMSDLGRFIGQSAGMLAADRTAAAGNDSGSVTATISAPADVVLALLAELDRRRRAEGDS